MKARLRLWLAVSGALLAGCEGEASVQLASSGALDAQEVRLAVSKVELTDDAGNVSTFDSDNHSVNDLTLYDDGGAITVLSKGNVGTARYVRVALTFDPTDAEIVDSSGDAWPISVPSSAATADVDFSLDDGDSVTVWTGLDLRLSLSDRTSTNSAWRLVPRLAAVSLDDDASLSGTISQALAESDDCLQGRADPDGAAMYAYPGSGIAPHDESPGASPHATGSVAVTWNADGTGSYTFLHLTPGDYTIALNCVSSADDPQAAQDQTFAGSANVTLGNGDAATLDFD